MSNERSKQVAHAFAEESEMDKTVDTLPETQANDNASLATGAPKRQSRRKQPYPCRSTQWVLGIEPQALVQQNLATPRWVGASRWADDQPKVSMPVSEDGDQGPEEVPLTVPPSDGQPNAPMPVSEDGDRGPEEVPLTAPPSDGQPKEPMPVSEDRDQGPEAPPLTVPRSRSQRRKQRHPYRFIKRLARTEPQAPVQQNLATPSQVGARTRADDQPKASMPVSKDQDQGSEVILLTAPSSDGQSKASMPVSEDGDRGPEEVPLAAPPSDGQPKVSMPVTEDGDQSPEVPLTALPSDGQSKASMPVSEDGDQGPEATPLTMPPSDEPEMTAAPVQNLKMGDFWKDPLFETTLTRLDDLFRDNSPSPSTSNPNV